MKRIRNIAAAVWIMCTVLSVSAQTSRPSREQTENINLLAVMNRNFLDCLNFNPKYQRIYVTKVSYSDYEKGIVFYGDNDYLAEATEYAFSNQIISSIKTMDLYKDGIMENSWCEFFADKKKLKMIQRYRGDKDPAILLYKIEDGNLEVIDEQNCKYIKSYEIIQKEDSREVYEWYDSGRGGLYWKIRRSGDMLEFYNDNRCFKYKNGILMEKYYSRSSTVYRYTTENGTGEYQKISEDGQVETVALLERKTDEDGYLIYQRLDYPSGESSEIFIAEELPDVSGLVNRAYPNFVPDRGELKTYW